MSLRFCLVLALAACGRIGFSNPSDDAPSDAAGDSTSSLGAPIACPVVRSVIDSDAMELMVEAGTVSPRLVGWRRAAGLVKFAHLDDDGTIGMRASLFDGVMVDRLVAAYPIATGHALVIEELGVEELFVVSSGLTSANRTGVARQGVGRAPLAGFGNFVVWAHAAETEANVLLVERIDGAGTPTPQSNRTTGANILDIAVGGARSDHAHLVWSEADGTCTSSEVFGGVPGLTDVTQIADCHELRNAAGIDDSIVTAYRTSSGALRVYALSPDYEHDFELSPSGRSPTISDDGTTVWATWFDDRAQGALVLAKLEITATSAVVTARVLAGVAPAGTKAVTLVDDTSPARLVVVEAGQLAVVQPCL